MNKSHSKAAAPIVGDIVRFKDDYMNRMWDELTIIGSEQGKKGVIFELKQVDPDFDRDDDPENFEPTGDLSQYGSDPTITYAAADKLIVVRQKGQTCLAI